LIAAAWWENNILKLGWSDPRKVREALPTWLLTLVGRFDFRRLAVWKVGDGIVDRRNISVP
jgi:hypothetical protein